MKLSCRISSEQDGAALLTILRRVLGLSSSFVARGKRTGVFTVNGSPAPTNLRLHAGDLVEASLDEPAPDFPAEHDPLEIVYEDDALLVLQKPAGLWVHPTASRLTGTLANRVLGYYQKTCQLAGVHVLTRLDRDTQGLVLLAKNAVSAARLTDSIQAGRLEKTYFAAVWGEPKADVGEIALPIGRSEPSSQRRAICPDGQPAFTSYVLLARENGASLLRLTPQTGRTHQLRVHCAALGCPILGDRLYATPASAKFSQAHGIPFQQLCAAGLRFPHPMTGAVMELSCTPRFLSGLFSCSLPVPAH